MMPSTPGPMRYSKSTATAPDSSPSPSQAHLERHPAAQTEWRRDMRDADFDDPQWIDPAFRHHRDVPKLTRAVRDQLRRAAASIGRTLDAIEARPWLP